MDIRVLFMGNGKYSVQKNIIALYFNFVIDLIHSLFNSVGKHAVA